MSKLPDSRIPLFRIKVEEKGRIKDIKEIVVRVEGLPSCLYGQIVQLGKDVRGIIMGFDEHDVLALVLGDPGRLHMGGEVSGISEPFRVPVGDGFVGRMVTALGEPCDQKGPIDASGHLDVLATSPPIVSRSPVDDFLFTGSRMLDVLVPLAKGQRQLILGDRVTGKTVMGVDAILAQAGRDVTCIYCAIGKSVSGLQKVMSALHEGRALDYTMVMIATDNAPVGEQYLVPFSAASMAEYFAAKGRDVLVVFDDLTKHAWAYRQLSLLLDRPPGREAYPGDVFYVQTQLMERAGRFNEAHGGGSITFLGIAETLQGDLTGYIPSNLASMCDGQVVLSSSIFAEGFRPAIDPMLSLSIIGGRVQPPILRSLARTLRADFARYMEIQALSRLQTGLSGEAEATVRKGECIRAILQQGQYTPSNLAEVVLLLYALDRGMVQPLTPDQRDRLRSEVYGFTLQQDGDLVRRIERKRELTPDIDRDLGKTLKLFLDRLK